MKKLKIGITMGDPAGIGPEIIIKALQKEWSENYEFIIYGYKSIFCEICNKANLKFPDVTFIEPEYIEGLSSSRYDSIEEFIPVINIEHGKIKKLYGLLAGLSIERSIQDINDGNIDAVVTAPINKKSFKDAGFKFAGHTEMFADLTNTKNYSMLLCHKNLRVLHLTTHIPFKYISEYITEEYISDKLILADQTLHRLGITNGRIGIAGLNPHCSDNGNFGNEETEIRKAIEKFDVETNQITGNSVTLEPADTIFCKAISGYYDLVLALYHDQGHIPVKLMGFIHDGKQWTEMNGVNVTIGLPVIRTSPDHGTAFGKAGKGLADESSMVQAISYTIQMIGDK